MPKSTRVLLAQPAKLAQRLKEYGSGVALSRPSRAAHRNYANPAAGDPFSGPGWLSACFRSFLS